jgi:polysaccharide deacetylase family protein (PEP-CTERM system associated)
MTIVFTSYVAFIVGVGFSYNLRLIFAETLTSVPVLTMLGVGEDATAIRQQGGRTGGTGFAQMLNALTIDVEDYFQVAALAPAVSISSWGSREYRAEQNTDRLLEIFDRHSVKGTFFVLGWIAERSPRLVQRIANAGHEVASHGYLHQCVYSQSVAEFRNETSRAKALLEDLVGKQVFGYRAASFSIVRRSLWALDVLLDLGFKYDSSVFPIRHDLYGIPDAAIAPGEVVTPTGRRMLEFPLSTAKWLGSRVPISGGGYFRVLPYWMTRAGLRQVNSDGRPFAFYLHPWEIDPEQPRIEAGRVARFRHYTNLAVCQARLERLLDEFPFGRMIDVLTQAGFGKALATVAPEAPEPRYRAPIDEWSPSAVSAASGPSFRN